MKRSEGTQGSISRRMDALISRFLSSVAMFVYVMVMLLVTAFAVFHFAGHGEPLVGLLVPCVFGLGYMTSVMSVMKKEATVVLQQGTPTQLPETR